MLTNLHIQNYALIDRLDINFERGFSVITGETGAGKSIILGAIGLLLGQRADSKSIKAGAAKCIIEAHFDLTNYDMKGFFEENDLEYDDECILRRELSASGKSRAFINDMPAQLSQMKELGEHLIDVHSQHQNLLLNKESFQLNVVDILANDAQEVKAYKEAYHHWRELSAELAHLTEEAEKSRADEDYLTFQLEQLDQLNIKEGEQEELETESDCLNHAEEIKNNLYMAGQYLNPEEGNGVLSALKDAGRQLRDIARVFPAADELQERMESCLIELKDISNEIESSLDQVEFNPTRLEQVNDRLNQLYSLEQKHHVQTDAELIALAEELRAKLQDITTYDERIEELTQAKKQAYEQVLGKASTLTNLRKNAAKEIEKKCPTCNSK